MIFADPLAAGPVRGEVDMSGNCRSCLIAAAVIASGLAAAPGQEPWWNAQWPYRRAVTVTRTPKATLPGDEIGVVTMLTGGLICPDGRDIRVTTARGQLLPHRVLMIGPGDVARVAFALRPPQTNYFVYFGNAKAQQPAEKLKIRRGVLLETWEYRGGGIATFELVRQAFERAGRLIGRDFRENIFLGHNPFGPQSKICNLFTGRLICPDEGNYVFSTSSNDASFLLIDGEVVVSNGGTHRPEPRARRQGRVRLSKGLHELKVYHVNGSGDPVVMAAWKPPSGRRLWAIPPRAFAPVFRARPGPLERYGSDLEVDFLAHQAGEAFMANLYFQRYRFTALLSARVGGKWEFAWDFGDGQTGSGESVEHVYLRNGPRRVTLKARAGRRELSRSHEIHVTRAWDEVTSDRLDPLARHARIVSGYDFAAAEPGDIARAIALFGRTDDKDAIVRAGEALIARERAPASVLRDALPTYVATLLEEHSGPDEPESGTSGAARAVNALLKAAGMTRNPAVAASLAVRAGQIALEAGKPQRALTLFQQSIKKYAALAPTKVIRDARIGIGDVYRLRGDYEKALASYRLAHPPEHGGFEKKLLRQGDLARHVEDYIRKGTYHDAEDYLNRWEWEFPADKLEGYSSLLRVKLAMARKDYAAAVREAELLVGVNPRSNYAPELLMLAAEACRAAGRDGKARQTLQRLIKDYPESPLAQRAKQNR